MHKVSFNGEKPVTRWAIVEKPYKQSARKKKKKQSKNKII